jgi:hypothetical protein
MRRMNQALVAHTCNPSCSGGREQGDGSQPRQIVCEILSQKNPAQKKGLAEWLKV